MPTSPGNASLPLGTPDTLRPARTHPSASGPFISYIRSSPTPSPDSNAYRLSSRSFQQEGPPQKQQQFNYDVKNGVPSQWSDWGSEGTTREKTEKPKGVGCRKSDEHGMEESERKYSAGWLRKKGRNVKEPSHSDSPRQNSDPKLERQSFAPTTLSSPSHPTRPPRPSTEYCPSVLHQTVALPIQPQTRSSGEETHGGGCGIFGRKTKKRPNHKKGHSIVVQMATDDGHMSAAKNVSPRAQRLTMTSMAVPVEEMETLERHSRTPSALFGSEQHKTAERVSMRRSHESQPTHRVPYLDDTSIAHLRRQLSSGSPPRGSHTSHDEHREFPSNPAVALRQSQQIEHWSPSRQTHSRTRSRDQSRNQSTDHVTTPSRTSNRNSNRISERNSAGPSQDIVNLTSSPESPRSSTHHTSSPPQSQQTIYLGYGEWMLSPRGSAASTAERYWPHKGFARGHTTSASWDSKAPTKTTPGGHLAHRCTGSVDSQRLATSNISTLTLTPTRLLGQAQTTPHDHHVQSVSTPPQRSPTKLPGGRDVKRDVIPARPQSSPQCIPYQPSPLVSQPTIPSPPKQAIIPISSHIPDSPTRHLERMRDADDYYILHLHHYAVQQPLAHRTISTVATFHNSHLAMPSPPFRQAAKEEVLLSSDDARSIDGSDVDVSTVGTVGTAGVDLARRALRQTYLTELSGEYEDGDEGTDMDGDAEGSGVSHYDDEPEKVYTREVIAGTVESEEKCSEIELEPVCSTSPLRVVSKTSAMDVVVMPEQGSVPPVPAARTLPVERTAEEELENPEIEVVEAPEERVQNTLRVPSVTSSKGGWMLHEGKCASRTSLRMCEEEDENGSDWDLDSYYGGVAGSATSRE